MNWDGIAAVGQGPSALALMFVVFQIGLTRNEPQTGVPNSSQPAKEAARIDFCRLQLAL